LGAGARPLDGDGRLLLASLRSRVSLRNRELVVFVPLYAWLSFIDYTVKVSKTRGDWYSVLPRKQHLLLNFDYTNNEQSRLLQFYVPEFFHRVLRTTIPHSYSIARLLFVFCAFVCFHYFLRRWFTAGEAFAGVALLAALTGFTHLNDLQESAPLLMFLFVAALYAIRDDHVRLLLAILLVGGLTNETMLILPLAYFAYHVRFGSWRRVLLPAGRAVLVAIPLLVTVGPIRYITRDQPHLGGAYNLPPNLRGINREIWDNPLDWPRNRYVYFIVFFGVIGVYAFLRYSEKPFFLRRAAWIIPPFIVAHLITGKIRESRQMIPLAFILIPMAMFFMLKPAADRPPWRRRVAKLLE
jgi:hypothetical protein